MRIATALLGFSIMLKRKKGGHVLFRKLPIVVYCANPSVCVHWSVLVIAAVVGEVPGFETDDC
jgi:UPF0716 family protein affecting phage T7 exclusion